MGLLRFFQMVLDFDMVRRGCYLPYLLKVILFYLFIYCVD